jgi:hypothetical protein
LSDPPPEHVPYVKLGFCHILSLGAEMSPIKLAAPLFITDCNGAWKGKIEKSTVQEAIRTII